MLSVYFAGKLQVYRLQANRTFQHTIPLQKQLLTKGKLIIGKQFHLKISKEVNYPETAPR